MTSDTLLRLLLFGVCIVCAGFFSGSETALFSLGRVRLARLREEGHPRAALLERLLSQPRRLIATIFIGNELVNIGAATIMASIMARYSVDLGETAIVLISTAISVPMVLFFGEITPKNIAQQVAVGWAVQVAWLLDWLAKLLAPLRILIQAIADLTVRVVGSGAGHADVATAVGAGEFRSLVEVARHEGQIDPHERQLIHRVLELGERTVSQVATPVARMFALSSKLPMARIIEELRVSQYSRIPVFEGSRERIVGVLYSKDLLVAARGLPGERRLKELLHEPFFVPPQARCDWLLREFRRRRVHLAIVVDEYGRTTGVITLEDVLEQVFGQIVDEKEQPQPEPRPGTHLDGSPLTPAPEPHGGGS